jgi:radical SAM protein with 4Fe4S-binding SPASM domain
MEDLRMRPPLYPTQTPFRPQICVWELTRSCNLRCDHCGSAAGEARAGELSTAECLDVVQQLADLECQLITLSGGEPTLRADWESIARAAIARGITVNMVTNGTTVTGALARRIADAGLANVAVSLDGTERLHNEVRGEGSFRRAAAGLRALAAAGVTTAVLTQLNRATAEALDETHALAVELGASMWRLQLAKPMGRLKCRTTLIAPRDLLDVLPRLSGIKQSSPIEVAVGDSIGYFGPADSVLRSRSQEPRGMRGPWGGCQAGRFAIGIESDGGVKACLSLQAKSEGGHDPFREGDLRRQRLAEIWCSPASFAFNRRPVALTGFCRRCDHAAVCRGGARCVAAAFGGKLTEDSYCYHRVASIQQGASTRLDRLRHYAAASALALGLGGLLSGCDHRSVPTTDGGADGVHATQRDGRHDGVRDDLLPPDSKLAPDTVDPCAGYCSCPDCDYGIWPPECYGKPCK